jgi:hypothetical protein
MAKGGVWGDNMEIVAFAAAYNTDVRIYLRDYSYMIPGQGEEADRMIAHIAYHVSLALVYGYTQTDEPPGMGALLLHT